MKSEVENKPYIIAGPCSIESLEQIQAIASELSTLGIKYLRGGVFKPRTSPSSFQGLGDVGLQYLRQAADENKMLVVTEVLESYQLEKSIDMIDVLQIGSKNMTSYGFLKNVGKITAQKGKPVFLKRGFHSTLREFLEAAEYIANEGNPNIILCLRGIRTFEQIDSIFRYTPDLASILELRNIMSDKKYPVFFDPSHSTGNSKFVVDISKAAIVLGADGLIIECHTNPNSALSDGSQSILPKEIEYLLNYINNSVQYENYKTST